jgi:hypothetical protein
VPGLGSGATWRDTASEDHSEITPAVAKERENPSIILVSISPWLAKAAILMRINDTASE